MDAMKHTVTIAPKFEATLYNIERDLFIKELYMKREDQVDDDDFQKWIDYRLGSPIFNTGFGQAWYKMVNRTIMVGDEEINALKAYNLNQTVASWWGQLKLFIHSMRV